MGTNDHQPTKQQRTKYKVLGKTHEQLDWSMAGADTLHHFIAVLSKNGGYVGFGQNQDASALLLYIRIGTINERIAVESAEGIIPTLAGILDDVVG